MPVDVWATDDSEIGVTSVIKPDDKAKVLYEVSLYFPSCFKLWRVQRSYADFASLHIQLENNFHTLLHDRKILFPRPARRSWEALRATYSQEAAQKMLQLLNVYLRRLLEIEDIHTSTIFRDFFTPRADSKDSEINGKLLPPFAPAAAAASTSSSPPPAPLLATLPAPPVEQLPELRAAPVNDMEIPPRARTEPMKQICEQSIYFGSAIELRTLGGLAIGLTRRSALSGSQKAAAVAVGMAGMAFTGPLSALVALSAVGGGMGKYQLNMSYYAAVKLPKPGLTNTYRNRLRSRSRSRSSSLMAGTNTSCAGNVGSFIVENAEQFSGPRRVVKFGDVIHLYCKSVRKNLRLSQPPDSKRGHLMVSTAESHRVTLRLVSPYGFTGSVVCGSQAYLQVVDSDWAGEFLSLNGEFIASGNSPMVFEVGLHSHMCHTREDHIMTVPKPVRKPLQLRVMVYNVWLMPSILSTFNEKLSPMGTQRAQAIPKCIAPLDVDVVIFCEAFCSTSREILVTGMKAQGYLYMTKVVGASAIMSTKKVIDGGVFAMSKYPIDHYQELTFGATATGDDRMSDKGVIYFQTRIGSEPVHVFGTHLQAWETPVAVDARKAQIKLVREFMDAMRISDQEAVVVAGDFNVNKACLENDEYDDMLEVLGTTDPELVPGTSPFSFDPTTNKLSVDGPSSGGITERLDYVMVAQSYRPVLESSSEVVPLKATKDWQAPPDDEELDTDEQLDLSDHYPVVSEFRFG